MDKRNAKEVIIRNLSRRNLLKYAGLSILGGSLISSREATAQEKGVHAISIHGHSLQVENPGNMQAIERQRFHTYVLGKSAVQTWFHFAIATPVLLNGRRLRAKSVNLNFETGSRKALVKHVQVYDGQKRLAIHSNVDLGGDLFDVQFDVHGYPPVTKGVGISIAVVFSGTEYIKVISAGCTFIE